MKSLEILSALPKWAKVSPDAILRSPAFAMPCRLGEEAAVLRPAAVEPSESGMLALSVAFGDEPHTLCLARSPRFPDLDTLWESRADVPEAIVLALVERECGPLFQLLENAVRKQFRLVGGGSPEAWKSGSLESWLAFQISDVVFSLTRSETVSRAFGALRNIDLTHESIRSDTLPAEVEYAAFQLPEADIASLAPGDAVMLPEIGSVQPRLVVDGRFFVDENGVSPYLEDSMCRVRDAAARTVALGALFDAAEDSRGGEEKGNGAASGVSAAPGAEMNAQLRLVKGGKTLASGHLGRLGDSPAFIVEAADAGRRN